MTDKLEALSQPVGLVTNQLDGAVIVESDQLLPGDNVYSQEHVTALTQRANAAEQREEHLKATVDVLSAKNAELQQRLQQPIPESLIAGVCMIASDIYYENDEDKAQDIINRIRDELQGFKVEGE
ncbi:hypothetical protein [Serratia fonticola]